MKSRKARGADGSKGKTPTATQVSSGGVIYRAPPGAGVEVALIAYTGRGGGRVWCLPKGGVEANESLEETARREVLEETGLSGEVEAKLGAIQYWYYGRQERVRYHKSVHFFLLRFREGRLEDHDLEAEDVRWFAIGEAVEALTYENERAILVRASAAIRERLGLVAAGEAGE
jgi:8-oxo-dGTP pyrophosphatase MutT (NUDIX family)